MDTEAIGRLMTALRTRYGLKQEEVAERLNVSRQAVSKWERGTSMPDVAQLLALSQLYGVKMEDLLLADERMLHGPLSHVLPEKNSVPRRVTVLGCGRWGSFLSWYADQLGHQVTLIGREGSAHLEMLRRTRQNDYLFLPERITLSTNPADMLSADVLLLAVGAQQLPAVATQLRELALHDSLIVLCMKGLESPTGRRLSQVVTDTVDHSNRLAVWVGPGQVQDLYRGIPNCMLVDSVDPLARDEVIRTFSSGLIRFYYGSDLVGTEIGAAAKNVIGIAAGMLDGADLTALKGALMARGTHEIALLISAMGGCPASAWGLCCLGDFEATLFSPHSRNRAYGESVTRGIPFTGLAEGVDTTRAIRNLGKSYGVELPVVNAVYRVLFEGADPRKTLDALFARSQKDEFPPLDMGSSVAYNGRKRR